MCKLLLSYGADPAIRNGEGKTPVDLASEHGHEETVELLRAHDGPTGVQEE